MQRIDSSFYTHIYLTTHQKESHLARSWLWITGWDLEDQYCEQHLKDSDGGDKGLFLAEWKN